MQGETPDPRGGAPGRAGQSSCQTGTTTYKLLCRRIRKRESASGHASDHRSAYGAVTRTTISRAGPSSPPRSRTRTVSSASPGGKAAVAATMLQNCSVAAGSM